MIRTFMRKYDMDEPPKLEEPIDENDSRMKKIREAKVNEQYLEEKYYRLVLVTLNLLRAWNIQQQYLHSNLSTFLSRCLNVRTLLALEEKKEFKIKSYHQFVCI